MKNQGKLRNARPQALKNEQDRESSFISSLSLSPALSHSLSLALHAFAYTEQLGVPLSLGKRTGGPVARTITLFNFIAKSLFFLFNVRLKLWVNQGDKVFFLRITKGMYWDYRWCSVIFNENPILIRSAHRVTNKVPVEERCKWCVNFANVCTKLSK